VRDIAHEDAEAQGADVEDILRELGVDPTDHERLIEVWNKADLLPEAERDRLEASAARKPEDERPSVVSAISGEGLPELLELVEHKLAQGRPVLNLRLDASDGEGQAWLYSHTEVLSRAEDDEGHADFEVRVAPQNRDRVLSRFP
jgi:GTP-binding protein HflX